VGVTAILIDQLFLQPRNARFRLHAMPMAVGMYLPWTVTTPILLGGIVFAAVNWVSKRRGDSDEQRQSIVHRGLLFCSGVVAGEAIMGIAIAVLFLLQLDLPIMKSWLNSDQWYVDAVSLMGLCVVIVYLMYISLRKKS
jgi:uncharacterized oligopeptide transporter (OPT) family protein